MDAHIDRWRNLPELAVNNPKTSESALYMPYVWQIPKFVRSYLRYVWQILLFIRKHLAYIWHVACENSHFGGVFLRFSPHASAMYKQDTSGQASESAIHRRDANRRQASSSYPGVQCAFLHTHVRLIASSTDANQTHQCSHRQRHTPRQQRDLTQTANISSLVDTRAHSRPHLHWTRGNVE